MGKWDSRLQFLNTFDYGSIHLPLRSASYHLSDIRTSLGNLWESAQPPVSPEILHELEQKVNADSKSYFLADSQNRYAFPVDLHSTALREYLCYVVAKDMPRPTLAKSLSDGAIQVETLEEFMRMTDFKTGSNLTAESCHR